MNAWAAAGGWLTVNYRPGRRLSVILAQAPGAGDMFNWTNEFTVVFRAFAVPYWEDTNATSVTSAVASSGSMNIIVPGSAETIANATIQNMSGMMITNVSLSIGGKAMSFSGSNLLPGGYSITIDHPQSEKMIYFRARNNAGSIMANRNGADDFNVQPGARGISFSANRAVRVTVSLKGRYL